MASVSSRVKEAEQYLLKKDFINIDSYVQIYEIFIAVFVKKSIRPDIYKIKKDYIKMGKVVGMSFGNKGVCAYSFTLRNRVFNFCGQHLKHGAESADARD